MHRMSRPYHAVLLKLQQERRENCTWNKNANNEGEKWDHGECERTMACNESVKGTVKGGY